MHDSLRSSEICASPLEKLNCLTPKWAVHAEFHRT
uniref:Uncharacterized protein n=1 Tax=Anguilla anguilla TaxID=7936 RepID=A0A0E9U2I6_ANGAN